MDENIQEQKLKESSSCFILIILFLVITLFLWKM